MNSSRSAPVRRSHSGPKTWRAASRPSNSARARLRTSSRACFALVATLRIAVTCPKKSSNSPRGEVSAALDMLEIRSTASIVPTARLKPLPLGPRAEPSRPTRVQGHGVAGETFGKAHCFESEFGIGPIVSIVRSLRSIDLDQVDRFAIEYPHKPSGYEVLPLSVKRTHCF